VTKKHSPPTMMLSAMMAIRASAIRPRHGNRPFTVIHERTKRFTSTVKSADKDRIATIRLYRILLRQCQALRVPSSDSSKEKDGAILLQPDLEVSGWGRHYISVLPKETTVKENLYHWFRTFNDDEDVDAFSSSIDDWYDEVAGSDPVPEGVPMITCWTTVSQLQDAIRHAFKLDYKSMADNTGLHKWAIRAIQTLQQQGTLWSHSSVANTEQIRVIATSRCIGTTTTSAAAMLDTKYTFCYRVRVENVSNEHVQLLGRYWNIQEMDQGEQEPYSRPPMVVNAPTTGAGTYNEEVENDFLSFFSPYVFH
jgi:hypothetical protein